MFIRLGEWFLLIWGRALTFISLLFILTLCSPDSYLAKALLF